MAKSRRAKKRNGHKSQVDEDPGPDISLLSRPSATSVKGIHDVIKAFEEGTHEVHHLLSNECEILYECRVCRSIYRSFLNFITHKRIYCQQQYTSGSPKVNHFFNDVLDEDETLIVHDELGKPTKQSNGDAPDIEPVPSTSFAKAKPAPRKNLMQILGLLSQKASSSEGLSRIINLDSFGAGSTSNAGTESTGFNGRMPRQHLLHLESMESTDVAIRQTVTLGPDGKILADSNAGTASEDDDDEKSSLHTNIENETETGLACAKCNITFSTRKTYRHHVNSVHDPSRILFVCPICKNKFANTWSVHRHMKSIHNKNIIQLRKLRDQIQKVKVVRKVSTEPVITSRKSASSTRATNDTQHIYIKKQMELELFEKETKQCSGCCRKFDRLAAFNYHVANCVKRLMALKNVTEANASADTPISFTSLNNTKHKMLSRSSQNLNAACAASNDDISDPVATKQENQISIVATLEPQERRNSEKRSEQPVTKKIEIQLRRNYNKITLGTITTTTELSEIITPESQEVTDKPAPLHAALSRIDYNKIVPRTKVDGVTVADDGEIIISNDDCHIEQSNCDMLFEIGEEISTERETPSVASSISNISETCVTSPKEAESIANISSGHQRRQSLSEIHAPQNGPQLMDVDEIKNLDVGNNSQGITLLLHQDCSSVKMMSDRGSTESVEVDVNGSKCFPEVSNNLDADTVLVPPSTKVKDIPLCTLDSDEMNDIPQKSILEGILTKIKTEASNRTMLNASGSNSSVGSVCVEMESTISRVNKSKRKKSLVKRASIMDWNGFEEQQTATLHNFESGMKRFKANDDADELLPGISGNKNTCQEGRYVCDPDLQDTTTIDCESKPSISHENHLNASHPMKAEGMMSSLVLVKSEIIIENDTPDEPVPLKGEEVEVDVSNYVECTLNEPANDNEYALSEPDSDKVCNDETVIPRYSTPSKADVDEDILKVIFEEEDLSQTSSLHHKKGTIIMGNGTFSLGPCTAYEKTELTEELVSCKTSSIGQKATESTESMSPITTDQLVYPVPTSSRLSSEIPTESRSSSRNTGRRVSIDRSTSSSDTEQRPLSAELTFSSSMESLAPRSRPFRNRAKVKSDDFIYDVSDKSVFSLKSGDDHSTGRHKSGSKASAKQSSENAVELVGKDGLMGSSMNPTVKLFKCSDDKGYFKVGTKKKSSASGDSQTNSNATGFSTNRKSVRTVTK